MAVIDLVLCLSWIGMLLLPNLTTIAFANAWETDVRALFAVSLWVIVFLYCCVPRRWFLAMTYPLIVAGAVVLGADFLRSVNLFDLAAVSYTFTRGEIIDAVRPYLGAVSLISIAALLPLWILWRGGELPGLSRPVRIAVVATGLVLALALPNHIWLNAWPVALVTAAIAAQSDGAGIELPATPNVRISPRDRHKSWKASRKVRPSGAETYVLVIGESVRSDRLNGCGGRTQIMAPPAESLVYCDVLSGSSSTHTSVPLLVSRELPGHLERVSSDSTFLKAFEEVGFETFWLSVQDRSIAWPDAQYQEYASLPQLDRDTLLPLLDRALAKPASRKFIVLHAYNAHGPYTERYRVATAPFEVETQIQGSLPAVSSLGTWWNAYDNAIDESMRFLDSVVERLRGQSGEAFLMFTPDHAENMLDDRRNLVQHALKFPTVWDTKVPGIVWANSAWRQIHPEKWRTLALNQGRPLMHMDFVPTLFGAAKIGYEEQRSLPVDMTSLVAGERTRIVQTRAGESVDLAVLYQAADAARR